MYDEALGVKDERKRSTPSSTGPRRVADPTRWRSVHSQGFSEVAASCMDAASSVMGAPSEVANLAELEDFDYDPQFNEELDQLYR